MHEMSASAFFEGAALVDSEGFRWRCLQPPEIKHLVHNQAVYASAGRVGRSLLAPAAPYRFSSCINCSLRNGDIMINNYRW